MRRLTDQIAPGGPGGHVVHAVVLRSSGAFPSRSVRAAAGGGADVDVRAMLEVTMKKGTFAILAVLLVTAVVAAVSTLAAQGRSDEQRSRQAQASAQLQGMTLVGPGARIGVSVDDLNEQELKAAAGAPSGVLIEEVGQDSPASKAGLLKGDIVVDVDGERVRSARQFSRLIQETPEGRSVRLGVVRDGKRQTVDVRPEARAFGFGPDSQFYAQIEPKLREQWRQLEPKLRELEPQFKREFRYNEPSFDFDFDRLMPFVSPRARLGVQLDELTPQLAEYFGAKNGGVLVSSVATASAAEKAGIKAGDVITSVDGTAVRGGSDLVAQLRDKSGEISLGIVRDKKESTMKATIEAPTPRRTFRRPA